MYLHLRIGWFIAFCFLYFACVFQPWRWISCNSRDRVSLCLVLLASASVWRDCAWAGGVDIFLVVWLCLHVHHALLFCPVFLLCLLTNVLSCIVINYVCILCECMCRNLAYPCSHTCIINVYLCMRIKSLKTKLTNPKDYSGGGFACAFHTHVDACNWSLRIVKITAVVHGGRPKCLMSAPR